MPNKDLKHSSFTVPSNIINKLKASIARHSNKTDEKGYSRAKGIIENPQINYTNMRNLKHYFNNYDGDGRDLEFEFNGGDLMKNWVQKTLNSTTDKIRLNKEVRMNSGEENTFIEKHEKDNNSRPTNVNLPKIKGSIKDILKTNKVRYESIEAEIEQIKYLNEYLSKSTKNRI